MMLEPLIRATEVNPKYNEAVENIMHDKASGWRHDYYKSNTTMFDVKVSRAQEEVRKYKTQIRKYTASLDKITADIEASNKPPQDPKYKKLTPKQVEALEAEYTDLYKLKCEQMVLLDGAQQVEQGLIWIQSTQRKRLEMLQNIRNGFMQDGDSEYMAKGVTWVEGYIENLGTMNA